MSCPTGTYRLAEGVRLRPLPELGACLAYRRRPVPALVTLNLTAWMVLELAPERTDAELEAAYRQAVGARLAPERIGTSLRRGLDSLREARLIVEPDAEEETPPGTT